MIKWILNFAKKLHQRFLWTRSSQFWQPCRNFFRQRFEMFSFIVRKWWKSFVFLQKSLALKLSPEHPFCIFDKLAKHFEKSWKEFCGLKTKMMKRMFILQKKIVKLFLCRRKLRFWQTCWNVSVRSPRKFRSKCGSRKNIVLVLSKKMFLPKTFLRTRSIWTMLAKSFRQKWICFSAHSAKVMKSK